MTRSEQKAFGDAVEISAFIVGAMLIAGVIGVFVPTLKAYGIWPRTLGGLVGIGLSPFLHASIAHLMANAIPLFVLLVFLYWDKHYSPKRTLAVIWIASGVGTWLIGRSDSVHIGASSIVYGLVAYLIVSGVMMRSVRSAVVAGVVFALYGGIIHGVLPHQGSVSWEGHLCGALAGIWAAWENTK